MHIGLKVAYLDYKTWQFADWICKPVAAFDDEHVSGCETRGPRADNNLLSQGTRHARRRKNDREFWRKGLIRRPVADAECDHGKARHSLDWRSPEWIRMSIMVLVTE